VQALNGISGNGMAALLQLAQGGMVPGMGSAQTSLAPAHGSQMSGSGQPAPRSQQARAVKPLFHD
jgi:hypothetical protein